MVISVNPTNGAVSAASIPRDTVAFPLPDGTKFGPKINELYQRYISRIGEKKAGPAMSKAVGRALRVEIDNYVVIGFDGVKRLVERRRRGERGPRQDDQGPGVLADARRSAASRSKPARTTSTASAR